MGNGEKAGNPLWSGEVLAWRCGSPCSCVPPYIWVALPSHLHPQFPPLQRAGSTADPLAVSLKEGHGGKAVQEGGLHKLHPSATVICVPSLWQRDTGAGGGQVLGDGWDLAGAGEGLHWGCLSIVWAWSLRPVGA